VEPSGDTKTIATDIALGATIDARDASPVQGAVPERLGERYRVTRVLGRGGMGAVYLAVDEALVCEVALKQVLVPGDALRRLRDEVRLAQRVTHPNVCRTYDLEEIDGNWLVKMEYVAGETLAVLLKKGPLPVTEAVRVAREVCVGLAAAHKQGVVHRDLKPHNIMIDAKTGRVVLMDFGIASAAEAAGQTADHVSGTPEYMAPEQVRGREVDGRADLYALGCVLYEMLTGKRVFTRPTRKATALAHVDDPAPALPGSVPERIRRAVARLLEKDPAKRPASADEVVAALADPPRRHARWLVAGLVVAAAAVGAIALRPVRHFQAQVVELPSYFENSDFPALSPDGKLYAYQSDREARGRFRVYVAALDGGATRAITPRELCAVNPRWQRDGQALLFSDNDSGRAFRVPLGGGPPEVLAEAAHWLDDCAGRLLLGYESSPGCGRCARLALRDPDGQERDLVRFPSGAKLLYPSCDRSGRRAVYSRVDEPVFGPHEPSDLWLVSFDGDSPRRLTNDHSGNHGTFTPDGRSILFGSARSGQWHLWEMPVDGSSEPVQRTFGEGWEGGPDVSADGRLVIYNVDVTAVQLYAQPLDGGPARQLTSSAQDLRNPQAAPDGRTLIAEATGAPTFVASIFSVPVEGGDPVKLFDGATPALTPDGAEIVYWVHGTGRVLAAPRGGGASRPVTEVPGRPINIAVGPEGRVHLVVARPPGWEAWGAPLAGGVAERELSAPWGLLLPAPRGGWRAAIEWDGGRRRVRFVPPGAALDDPSARELVEEGRGGQAWMPDGRSWVYVEDTHAVRRFFVDTAENRLVSEGGDLRDVAVSPDGKTIYTTQNLAHVRRQLITNFADRPRSR
jgi:Tol biopolymer transport system component